MDRRFSIFTFNFSLYDGIINFDLGIYNNLYSIPISCFVAQAQKKDLLFLPLGRISNSRPWSLYHVCFFQLLINFQSRLIDIRINNRSAVSICISFRYLSNFSFSIYCPHTRFISQLECNKLPHESLQIYDRRSNER